MSFADDILHGLTEFKDELDKGGEVAKKLTVRKVKLNLKPEPYDPETVKLTRDILNVSQQVFAEFIGVSVKTVQAWEQGSNTVTGAPARLMDEIRQDPEYWQQRIAEAIDEVVS